MLQSVKLEALQWVLSRGIPRVDCWGILLEAQAESHQVYLLQKAHYFVCFNVPAFTYHESYPDQI